MSKTWTEEVVAKAQELSKSKRKELKKALAQDVYNSKTPGDEAFLAWMAKMIQQYPPQAWEVPGEGVVVESLFTVCLRRMEGGREDWQRWVKLTTQRALDEGGY